jgi:hypothetical protein
MNRTEFKKICSAFDEKIDKYTMYLEKKWTNSSDIYTFDKIIAKLNKSDDNWKWQKCPRLFQCDKCLQWRSVDYGNRHILKDEWVCYMIQHVQYQLIDVNILPYLKLIN